MMLALAVLLAGLQVHEWGMISGSPMLLAGSSEPLLAPTHPDELVDRAPVLYFHGDPCTVDVKVTFHCMGYATSVVPAPSRGGVNSTYLTWEGVTLTEQPPEGLTEGWSEAENSPMPSEVWRRVDALYAAHRTRYDRFLYYECVPGSPGDLPFTSVGGNRSFRLEYLHLPCIVLVNGGNAPMYGVFTLGDIQGSIPKGLRFLETPLELEREVRRWAEGVINADEFDAYWNTWESLLLEESSLVPMILYPVPAEVVEGIAALEVTPEGGGDVTYSRFITVLIPYR
jgi:hypothetical protein